MIARLWPRSTSFHCLLGVLLVAGLVTGLGLRPASALMFSQGKLTGRTIALSDRLNAPSRHLNSPAERTTVRGGEAQKSSPVDSNFAARVHQMLDQQLAALADSFRVPGVVVSVVRAEGPVALRGHGFSDIEAESPMDPETSVLRVASVSKPFTAALVRELHARGAIDLDAPVQALGTSVGAVVRTGRSGETADSLSLAHLLAHTSGLDGRLLGDGSTRPPTPLPRLLERRLPPRIDPPGITSRYSNYGYALAGSIVAEIAGRSFAETADSLLWRPLGMTATTFSDRVNVDGARPARAYQPTGNGFEVLPRDFITLPPAGGLRTTAADVSRFLSAVTAADAADGGESISREVRRFARIGTPEDAFAGRRGHLGWFWRTEKGRDVYFHDGQYPGAGSYMAVVPEDSVAVFVAGNATGAASLGREIGDRVLSLLDRPASDAQGGTQTQRLSQRESPTVASSSLASLDGRYRLARRPHTSFESALALFDVPYPEVPVTSSGDTTITVRLADRTIRARHVGSLRFLDLDADVEPIHAVVEGPGITPRLRVGTSTFEQIPPTASQSLHVAWFSICILFIATIFGIPIRDFFREGGADDDLPDGMQYARPLAIFCAALHIGFLFALAFRLFTAGPLGLVQTDPAVIIPLLLFPITAGVFSLGLAGFAIRAWKTRSWSTTGRVHFTLVTIAQLAYLPFLWYWDLIAVPVA